jgi:hypothetical protein
MAEWITCPHCSLKHSLRPEGHCPRCKQSVAPEAAAPPESPFPAPPAPPAPTAPTAPSVVGVTATRRAVPPPLPPGVAGARGPAPARAAVGCVNHPEVTEDLLPCARCQRRFCTNCLVALRDGFFCAECKEEQVREVQSGATGEKLRVTEAIGLGWQLVTSNLGPFWVVGFVYFALQIPMSLLGAIPYIGAVFSLTNAVVVKPQLDAGLVYAVLRVIDGGAPNVGDLFEGFKQRFGACIVMMLPAWVVGIVGMFAVGGGIMAILAASGGFSHERHSQEPPAAFFVFLVVAVVIGLCVAIVVQATVWFATVALWESDHAGWPAFQAGWRVVRTHFWATVALLLLFALIGLVAVIAGVLALCVGVLFTFPFTTVWGTCTYAYLYRSWSQDDGSRRLGHAGWQPAHGRG